MAGIGKHGPCVVWFSGLSGAGKTTIAQIVEQRIAKCGCSSFLLDGDLVRNGLSNDLGFSEAARTENLRRSAEVAGLLADAGFIVLAAFITPREVDRQRIRDILEQHEVIEVFVGTALEVAESRDAKGLYRRARNGEIPNFTGITAPFEPPLSADLRLDTAPYDAGTLAERVIEELIKRRVVASTTREVTSA